MSEWPQIVELLRRRLRGRQMQWRKCRFVVGTGRPKLLLSRFVSPWRFPNWHKEEKFDFKLALMKQIKQDLCKSQGHPKKVFEIGFR